MVRIPSVEVDLSVTYIYKKFYHRVIYSNYKTCEIIKTNKYHYKNC